MTLPFTREQFIDVFASYNEAVWPVQWLAYAVGIVMALLAAFPRPGGDRVVGLGLAAMWLWTGIAYHWIHFTSINKAAGAFGAMFVLQGLLLLHASVRKAPSLTFGPARGLPRWAGWALVAYAALAYPLVGIYLGGHAYPAMPVFGITPCPVTIFTLGLLLLTTSKVSPWLLAIPFIWSLIGGSAAFALGVPQDWVLLAGPLVLPWLVWRDHRRASLDAAQARAVAGS